MTQRTLRVNATAQLLAGELTKQILDGVEYLVAPSIPIVEGVLNGVFVPAEEIGEFYEAWNGRPLPLRHPKSNGHYLSANSPQIMQEQVFGQFWNAAFESPKLKGEMWMNADKMRKAAGDALEVLSRIEAGEPVEVSTAYWCELEEAEGEFGGVPYTAIARNIRPDHIALLPDEQGACNWKDGCGVPRTNARLVANELEMSDKVSMVRMAFWSQYQPAGDEFWDLDIVGVFEESIIAKDWASKRHIAVPYSLNDAGEVTFGEATAVEVVYRAVDSQIEVVINQEIEDMPTNMQNDTPQEAQPQANGQSLPKSPAQKPKPAPQVNEEAPAEAGIVQGVESALSDELKEVAALLKELGGAEGIRESLSLIKANRDETRRHLIGELAANSQCAFDEAELEEMPTKNLQKLAQSLRVPNYAGRGGVRAHSADDGEWENYTDPYTKQ